jgi:hypothetical protein
LETLKIVIFILSLLSFLVLGVVLFVGSIVVQKRREADVKYSRSKWLGVRGNVTEAVEVVQSEKQWLFLCFEWEVNGERYSSEQRWQGDGREKIGHTTGETITVYYNPEHPSEGVVYPDLSIKIDAYSSKLLWTFEAMVVSGVVCMWSAPEYMVSAFWRWAAMFAGLIVSMGIITYYLGKKHHW